MGKMKEIAQIHVYRHPHVYLEDILEENEYNTFLKPFGYTFKNVPFNETIKWEVTEKCSNKLLDKVNNTLLLLGFKPNDIVYLEL